MDIYFAVSDDMSLKHGMKETRIPGTWNWTLSPAPETYIGSIIFSSSQAVISYLKEFNIPLKGITIVKADVPDYVATAAIRCVLIGDVMREISVVITEKVITFT